MVDSTSTISPLPADAIAQIKSSIAITSLNGVVLELLKNSLDAQSGNIDVSIEYNRGSCIIEDDGFGILPVEFKDGGGLGKLYCMLSYFDNAHLLLSRPTQHPLSALISGADQDTSCGSFLASLAALSLLQITSRHHQYHSHNSLSINRSQVIARQVPTPPHQHILTFKHGTRVAVRDLFGNMPVRVKQRAVEMDRPSAGSRDWEELRKMVTNLVLAWPRSVVITVKDIFSDRKLHLRGIGPGDALPHVADEPTFVRHICSTLTQAKFITSPEQVKWVPVNASTPGISIHGAMSLWPAPTKSIQFLSLGIHPLSAKNYNPILDEINRLFNNSNFGIEDEQIDIDNIERARRSDEARHISEGFTKKELKVPGKGVDKWPMFFIKIEIHDQIIDFVDNSARDILDDERGMIGSIIELIQAMIFEFLRSHHIRPKYCYRLRSSQNLGVQTVSSLSSVPKIQYGQERVTSESSRVSPTARSTERTRVSSSGSRVKRKSSINARSQSIESPFNAWSRIKIGRPRTPSNQSQDADYEKKVQSQEGCVVVDHTEIRRSNLTSITGSRQDVESKQTSILHSIEGESAKNKAKVDFPILTKSGKITRPPFNDSQLPTLGSRSGVSVQKHTPSYNRDSGPEENEFLPWINPRTKESWLVNSRTGLLEQPISIEVKKQLSMCANNFGGAGQVALSYSPKAPILKEMAPWIDGVLRGWNNPVYPSAEIPIPQVWTSDPDGEVQQPMHSRQISSLQFGIDRAFHEPSARLTGRITKEDLCQAEIVSQVDRKFILIKLPARSSNVQALQERSFAETLVLVDQHAADERCRIECLMAEFCSPIPSEEGLGISALRQPGVLTSRLEKPLSFALSKREIQLLEMYSQHFANWGILFDLSPTNPTAGQNHEFKITVKSLPPGIVEKCRAVPKLLIELLRSEVWNCHERGQSHENHNASTRQHQFSISDSSNDSAIMFNDELSNEQCKEVISRLAECAFPFQCAHGRPSMIPIVDLGVFDQLGLSDIDRDISRKEQLGVAFKAWKRRMSEIIDR